MSVHHTSGSSGGLGSVFKSFTKSLKTTSSSTPSSSSSKNVVPVSINPTVVGGGQDLQIIIQQLTTNSSNSTKLAALIKLTDSLSKYSISSIPEIWYLIHDLLDGRKYPSNIRRQTLKLCRECIKHDDNKGVGDKLNYFNDIVKYCRFKTGSGNTSLIIDPEYDLFLQALVELTDNGRDIHDFIIYDEKNSLDVFLEDSLIGFRNVVNSKKYRFQSDEQDKELLEKDRDFRTLINLIEFIKNCLNFNYTVLEESFVNVMIYRLIKLGSKSSNKSILTSVIASLNIIFSFGNPPLQYFSNIIQFLTSIYGSSLDSQLNSLIWDSITSLCLPDSIQLVISTLSDNISNPDLQRSRSSDATIASAVVANPTIYSSIGAFQLIIKIQIKNSIEDLSMDFTFLKIIRTVKSALSFNIPMINTSYLRTFDKLLAKESYLDNFGFKFQDSMDKILPFQLWYSSNNSIYDCLKKLKINTDQDIDYLQSICLSLQTLYENHELSTPKDKLIDFFMGNSPYLPNQTILFILQSYNDEKSCSLLNPFWKDYVLKILNQFYYQHDSDQVRLECLTVILQGLKVSHSIFTKEDINYDLIVDIFKKSKRETSGPVLSFLTNELFSFICLESSHQTFQHLISIILSLYIEKRPVRQESIYSRSFVTLSSTGASSVANTSVDFLHGITKGIVQVFLKCVARDPGRAVQCFNILIDITDMCAFNGDLLLIICKLFVRLRVTSEGYIYVTQPNDMMGLASAFKRDVASNTNPNAKWVYPETVDYLDETYFNQINKRLKLADNQEEDVNYIDIKKWIHLALRIMKEFIDWEVYSFVWGHFCWQLSNMELLLGCQEEIVEFRRIVCEQLTLNLPSQLKLNQELSKSDLQVVFVRSLSSLIGYHDLFSKYDQDQIINSLIFGLGQSWDKTAIPCINILTVCCFEIPLSVKKFLTTILMKLQTTITSSANTSPHILEFLMSLVHLPILTSNFTIEEFRRVFGIAFKYIQYANDLKTRQNLSSTEIIQKHGVEAQVEQSPSTTTQSMGDLTPILSQYILMISYDVISSWFLKINIQDRKKLSSFIIKNLINCNSDITKLDEQTVGFIDFIIRFTYSDLPLTIIGIDKPVENRLLNRWIMGNSILSIETDTTNGDSEINIRRPTGVTKLTMTLRQNNSATITPNYYLLQLFDHLESKNKPIPIIEDSIVSRALSVLDRIPGVKFHKIGIIYIGKGQTTEDEVLSNKVGSLAYHKFLNKIGDLTKLKNNREIYVGGLDIENNIDGEFSRYWRDKTTQLIFHITTMMTNDDIQLKKRHIGNDYVNIFFDESGQQEFNFNLIKSQFNFLNIVITPSAINKDVSIESMRVKQDSLESEDAKNTPKFYKVKLYRRSGVPAIFSTCHFKLISQDKLSQFIRNLSISANEFAHIWHSQGIYNSNWSQRVKQLMIIKNKSLDTYNHLKQEQQQEQENDDDDIENETTTQSFFDQLGGTSTRDITKSSHEYKFEYNKDNEDEEGVKLNELYQLYQAFVMVDTSTPVSVPLDSPGPGNQVGSDNNQPFPMSNQAPPYPGGMNYQAQPMNYQAPPMNYQGPPMNYQPHPMNYPPPPTNYPPPPTNYPPPPTNYQPPMNYQPPINYHAPPVYHQPPPMNKHSRPTHIPTPPMPDPDPPLTKDEIETRAIGMLQDQSIKDFLKEPTTNQVFFKTFDNPKRDADLQNAFHYIAQRNNSKFIMECICDDQIPIPIRLQKLLYPDSLPDDLREDYAKERDVPKREWKKFMKMIRTVHGMQKYGSRPRKMKNSITYLLRCPRQRLPTETLKNVERQRNSRPIQKCNCKCELSYFKVGKKYSYTWRWKHSGHHFFEVDGGLGLRMSDDLSAFLYKCAEQEEPWATVSKKLDEETKKGTFGPICASYGHKISSSHYLFRVNKVKKMGYAAAIRESIDQDDGESSDENNDSNSSLEVIPSYAGYQNNHGPPGYFIPSGYEEGMQLRTYHDRRQELYEFVYQIPNILSNVKTVHEWRLKRLKESVFDLLQE
ncbi:Tuberous sclerosis 2 protein [Spathaspora sp. JA1]|nr:Tuberous sclerosis 2 protein [Spathaspora sp. JA1]